MRSAHSGGGQWYGAGLRVDRHGWRSPSPVSTHPPVEWILPCIFPFLRSRGHWTLLVTFIFYGFFPNFIISIQHIFNSALISSISSLSICPLPPNIHSKPDSTASTAEISPFLSLSKGSNVGQLGQPFSKLPGHDHGWVDFAPLGTASLTWLIPLVDFDWSRKFNLRYTAEFVWSLTLLRVKYI